MWLSLIPSDYILDSLDSPASFTIKSNPGCNQALGLVSDIGHDKPLRYKLCKEFIDFFALYEVNISTRKKQYLHFNVDNQQAIVATVEEDCLK